MKLPNFIRAIFAPEHRLPVERPRFVDLDPDVRAAIFEGAQRAAAERAPQYARNFALSPDRLSARNRKTAATKRANKAKAG